MDYRELAEKAAPRNGATQEWVFRVLRDGIISGDLKGGTQLKQDEISAALSVSHIPVREALRQLEAQGLVRIHPNRGASVTELNRDTLEDMMEIRASISYYVLRRAIPLMTEEDFSELQEIIEEQKHTDDLFEAETLNYKFHDVLTRRAGNSVADMLIELVHANTDRYLRSSFYGSSPDRKESIEQHQAILDECRKGDCQKACELLHDHILGACKHIPADLK